jgi:hypothetical protein
MTDPGAGRDSRRMGQFVEEALHITVEQPVVATDHGSVHHRQQRQPAITDKTVDIILIRGDHPAHLLDQVGMAVLDSQILCDRGE